IVAQRAAFAEITETNFISFRKSVPLRRFARETNAFFLRFDRDEPRSGQSPRCDHSHCADATAEIEHGARARTPTRAVPRREHVVGREAMTVGELKETEVTTDRVECFPFARRRSTTE